MLDNLAKQFEAEAQQKKNEEMFVASAKITNDINSAKRYAFMDENLKLSPTEYNDAKQELKGVDTNNIYESFK